MVLAEFTCDSVIGEKDKKNIGRIYWPIGQHMNKSQKVTIWAVSH